MSTTAILTNLLRHQAWAHDGFLKILAETDAEAHAEVRHTALRILNHCYVVNQIFAGHLTGRPHGYAENNTIETPTPDALRGACGLRSLAARVHGVDDAGAAVRARPVHFHRRRSRRDDA